MYTKKYHAQELTGDGTHEKNYVVAVEDTIELFINDAQIASILATPEMQKELAYGYLICEGIVKAPDDIQGIRIDGNTIHIEVEPTEHLEL
jgi:FdhD protein